MDPLSILALIGTVLAVSGTVDLYLKYKLKKLEQRKDNALPTHVLSAEITELIKSECVMHNNKIPAFVSLTVHKDIVTVKYETGGKSYTHMFTRIQDF